MASDENKNTDTDRRPLGQLIMDMPLLLLFIGLLIMLMFYTFWGLYEILSLPQM